MITFTLIVIAAYCVIVLLFSIFQRRLTYFPEQSAITPEEAEVPEMQVVTLHTSDNLAIKGWYRPPTQPNLPTILYLHGNAGHIGYRAGLIEPYLKQGYGVFLLTYRGYSQNPGFPTEEGLYRDARAALDFLHSPNVVLFGESIGASVAIQMAQEYKVKALILQSPFTSLADVGVYHYPFIPVRFLLKERYESLKKAKDLHLPVLLLHGKNDGIIPPIMSQKLFDALPGPKTLQIIPNTGHNDLYEPATVIHFLISL